MDYLTELTILAYVAAAMIFGALLGLERKLADKPAGVRTHMLVSGAAALLVLLGDVWVEHFHDALDARSMQSGAIRIQTDPIRIVEAVVAGVAFLGAGTIIRGRMSDVHGLTTAASLLFTAAIGICTGLRELVLAGGATFLGLATLRLVRVMEEKLKRKLTPTS